MSTPEQHTNWRECADELPDTDETVLISSPTADEPVWLGFHDGDRWRNVDGQISPEVTHWAPMPEPPGS